MLLTEEQTLIRDTARAFAREQVLPHDPGHSALRPRAPEAAEILSPPIKYPEQGIRNLLLA